MAFLTDAAARHFRFFDPIANSGIRRARLERFVVAAKGACEIAAALTFIIAAMAALALLQIWAWVPHLIR
ncbi:MAG TPA: hypothetical protein VHU22_07735 [Xanthobacteraceae bacterium]|jgi:hypothetical protein|nr:hypothetical protein [Xanthobacteraceae bacterium]